ncbi:MAG: nucleotidyltransferase [Deltaproteobacteria bacterium]|uniref:Nucleotidyltransferase n=1 Tax=Candidatus Zymogenus saltonus TaxID=2844893 RepID=A0A9D8KD60_9DELT|nr:nucleotidyltransferase [Candidatus Zymogenus saltonus]
MKRDRTSIVIMAAGMGSRYGGLKQLDPVGPNGELLIHYTLYDAHNSGFDKAVFVIRREFEDEFKEMVSRFMPSEMEAVYAYQGLEGLPEGRKKPWGTGHAVFVCRDLIDEPFGVVNADDFYGRSSFKALNEFLRSSECNESTYSMVGYLLKNTVSPHGAVTRGISNVTDSWLVTIEETRGIEIRDGSIGFEREGVWEKLDPLTAVSMNFWGFDPYIFEHIERELSLFLKENKNDQKAEFLIPNVVASLVENKRARVKVIDTEEVWFGMTHPEDREIVMGEIRSMIGEGVYPKKLK